MTTSRMSLHLCSQKWYQKPWLKERISEGVVPHQYASKSVDIDKSQPYCNITRENHISRHNICCKKIDLGRQISTPWINDNWLKQIQD